MRAAAVLLAAVVSGVAIACGVAGGGRPGYVAANERLLETLPRYPGAREVSRSTSERAGGDSAYAPPAGYTTLVVYELPRRVPQRRVIDFYVARLDGWRSDVQFAPGVDVVTGEDRPGAWSAMFTRDGASVGVNTDNLIVGRRYELSVDHDRAGSGD